jgi:hypothetical protein
MTAILLFCDNHKLLSEEWFASAVSIGITYVVFIMGVPALVFQTFIPDELRSIYNKRFPTHWTPFYKQMGIIIGLFLLSCPLILNWIEGINSYVLFRLVAATVFFGVCAVLWIGWKYLLEKFESSRNIEHRLFEKIAEDTIAQFKKTGKLDADCLDDLRIMAKALPAGNTKNEFLAQCERIIEFFLQELPLGQDTKIIGELLEESVCLSITYDGAQYNNENIRKTLDILFLTYHQVNNVAASVEDRPKNPYLNTTIGSCMKEIGVKAMIKKDLASVMDAVEKLSAIDSTAHEMFVLGNEAIKEGHITTAVTVMKKLGGKVPNDISSASKLNPEERRNLFFWLGLVSKLGLQNGSAGEFANRQLQNVFKQFGENKADIQSTLKNAQAHFYVLADFSTIDALRVLEASLFPKKTGKSKD